MNLLPDNVRLPTDLPDAFATDFRFGYVGRVILNDLDAFGHVNNTRYLVYVETARLLHLQAAIGLRDLNDISIIMAHQEINYRRPVLYDKTFVVGVHVAWVRRSSFGFRFKILALDGDVWQHAADGGGTLVYYDYNAHASAPLPDEWRQKLLDFEGAERVELR